MTGIVIRLSTIRRVEFVCPQCGVDRDGNLVDRQRWFVVMRLPVIPLATLDPMVECQVCAHQCGVGVLAVPTAAALSEMLRTAMRHAITAVIRRGGPSPSDATERYAVTMMRGAGFQYDRFDLAADLCDCGDAGVSPTMRPLADELTPHGKQNLVHRLHSLAAIDGPVRPAQREVLLCIGVALGMAAPHINGILAVAPQHGLSSAV